MYLKIMFVLFSVVLNACTPTTANNQNGAMVVYDYGIFVVNHGRHTGIVINRACINPSFPLLASLSVRTDFIEIGWGDKKYYQARTPTLFMALQAVLYPTESVIQVVELPTWPTDYFSDSEVVELQVSEAGYGDLLKFIEQTFFKDENGHPVNTGKSLYGRGFFYSAIGKFHAFRTCNTWTAEALAKAGLPITDSLIITADDLMKEVRKISASR